MIKTLQTLLGAILLPLLLAAPALVLVAARDVPASKQDRVAMRGSCVVVGLDCSQAHTLPTFARVR